MEGLIPLIKPEAWRSGPAPVDPQDGRQAGDLRVLSDGSTNGVSKAADFGLPSPGFPRDLISWPPHPTPPGRQQQAGTLKTVQEFAVSRKAVRGVAGSEHRRAIWPLFPGLV